MVQHIRVLLWRAGAFLALAVGAVGVVIPVLPTVPFLILAAWAASNGWPVLEKRLLEHPTYGPHIRAWRERRIVPRKAKWFATVMMLASAIALQLTSTAPWLKAGAPLLMLGVAIWLWTRSEG